MKKLFVLAAALCAAHAQAALVTIEYTAKIGDIIAEAYPWTMDSVDSTDWAGFTITVGETVTGRVTYDDAGGRPNDWGGASTGDVQYTLTFNGSGKTFDYSMDGGMSSTPSSIVIGGGGAPGFIPATDIRFSVPEGAIAAGSLPTAGAWEHATVYADNGLYPFSMSFMLPESKYLWIFGTEGSVRVVSAVPEPSTYGMLIAGLAVAGAVARRRQQQEKV